MGSVDSDRNDPDRISEVGLRSKEILEVGFRSKYLPKVWDRKEWDRRLSPGKYYNKNSDRIIFVSIRNQIEISG